jgi:uncharacterized protein with PIN domain
MKKLTFSEFQNRVEAVAKASKIFMPHVTNSISTAFELYQKILAEEEMSLTITTQETGTQALTPMDDYERPKCPECNFEMRLKLFAKDPDGVEWPTAWICTNCLAEFYSEKTEPEWREELNIAKHVQK